VRIRIATLNAWALPEPIGVDIPVRMRAIGARLPDLDLDVMAFQEVWTTDARRALVAAGRRAGLTNAWHRTDLLAGSGLLVLSRLPIDEIRFEQFAVGGVPQHPSHAEFIGGKGFVRLRLRTPEGPLTFIDTHLHARYKRDVAHQYRPHRTGQVVQLAMATLKTRDPILTVGDFNFQEGQPEYTVLTGLTGMRDIAAVLDRREPTIFRGHPYRPRRRKPDRRIDFVFARDGAARSLIGRRELEIAPQLGTAVATPTRRAVALASRLLSEGRADAERRQRGGRAWAGLGIGSAVLASAGLRAPAMSRRRMLRTALEGAALLALTPGVGMSILSEVFVPSEIRAFDALAARLEQVDPGAPHETIA
jgi:endonuclease/exonuclease/phosphatase family metal-dependent hydrolase